VDNQTVRIPYRVRCLDIRDDQAVRELLGSLPPPDQLAAARREGLMQFAIPAIDIIGLDSPAQQAEAELSAYLRRRQEKAPAAVTDHALETWRLERERSARLLELTQQLHEAESAARNANAEARRLFKAGDLQGAEEMEAAAAKHERRVKTAQAALESLPKVETLRHTASNSHRERQQHEDQAFGKEIDQRLSEVYRKLGAVKYVGAEGEISLPDLLYEAAMLGALSFLLATRLGIKRT